MKKLLALVFVCAFACSGYAAEKIRVACVGDSITYGHGIPNRQKRAYPGQLQDLVGDKYDVRNFGVNAKTMLNHKWDSYITTGVCKNALKFNPNIVIIMLGTNDTKHWKRMGDNFATDAANIVDAFAKLEAKPKIYLCRPVPVFKDKWGINEKSLTEGVIPAINKVAKEKGCKIVDLHKALSGKGDLFPDKIHPNDAGSTVMAKTLRDAILKK